MYSTSVNIKTVTGGSDPIAVIDAAIKVAEPTVGDLLYAGQRQRTRILERTAKGVDVNETSFHPYSSRGPVYYYPGKGAKNRRAAVTRTARKLGIRLKGGPNQKGVGVTRLGIKFPNYAAMKAAFGRTVVDLRGLSAPHMLQAVLVKVAGVIVGGTDSQADFTNKQPANEIILGIYGEEGARASGHNEGRGHLPKRKFFGASDSDKTLVLADILTRVSFRVRQALGGKS